MAQAVDSAIRTVEVAAGPATIVARTCGAGDAVLMNPSWARGASDFDDLMRAVAATGFRAIAISPRGIEGSEGPFEGMTTWDMADDAAAVIEALQAAPVHVLGHAGGNRVARALATRHPGLVRTVILLAAGGRHTIPEKFKLFSEQTLFREPTREEFLAIMHASGFFAAHVDPSVWLEGWWRAVARPQWQAHQRVKPEEWWAGGGKPILIIQGLDDGIGPPENGREVKRLYPDRVTLVELPDVAHAMLPEAPEAIARVVIEWLRRA